MTLIQAQTESKPLSEGASIEQKKKGSYITNLIPHNLGLLYKSFCELLPIRSTKFSYEKRGWILHLRLKSDKYPMPTYRP
jgi:hypothetical protein